MVVAGVAPVVAAALVGVAPAGVTVAVTSTPLWLTGLPLASWSWTTGCCANATPLCAVAEGGVVSVSWVAALALRAIAPELTGSNAHTSELQAQLPALSLSLIPLNVAAPV